MRGFNEISGKTGIEGIRRKSFSDKIPDFTKTGNSEIADKVPDFSRNTNKGGLRW